MVINLDMGLWDVLLLVVVSVQATVIAYLPQPKWKALMITLPFPFSIAFLAVGSPVDSTNVFGLVLLMCFIYGVRLLHTNFKVPIIPAIIVSALGYCAFGTAYTAILPPDKWIFWLICVVVLGLGGILLIKQSHKNEKNHRSDLPVWIKLPIILAVVFLLLMIKNQLRGFMTVFPMVGIAAAYEARHSLGTMCRQMPVIILTLTPMMIVISLTQDSLGMEMSVLLAWIVFLATLIPLTRYTWSRLPDVQGEFPLGNGPNINPTIHENLKFKT